MCRLGLIKVYILVCLCHFGEAQLQEEIRTSNSECFQNGVAIAPDCTSSDYTIAIQDLITGSKLTSTECLLAWDETMNNDTTCCMANTTTDCIITITDIASSNTYRNLVLSCNGQQSSCGFEASQVSYDTGACPSGNSYLQPTNYMYSTYYCIESSRISGIGGNNVHLSGTNTTLYVWNDNTPTSGFSTIQEEYELTVQSDDLTSGLKLHTIQRDLDCDVEIIVKDVGDNVIADWDCENRTYNLETINTTSHYVKITIRNNGTASNTLWWMGFEATTPSLLTIHHPPQVNSTNNSESVPRSDSGSDSGLDLFSDTVVIIIWAIVAVLFLIMLVLLVLMILTLRTRSKRKHLLQQENYSKENGQEGNDSNVSETPILTLEKNETETVERAGETPILAFEKNVTETTERTENTPILTLEKNETETAERTEEAQILALENDNQSYETVIENEYVLKSSENVILPKAVAKVPVEKLDKETNTDTEKQFGTNIATQYSVEVMDNSSQIYVSRTERGMNTEPLTQTNSTMQTVKVHSLCKATQYKKHDTILTNREDKECQTDVYLLEIRATNGHDNGLNVTSEIDEAATNIREQPDPLNADTDDAEEDTEQPCKITTKDKIDRNGTLKSVMFQNLSRYEILRRKVRLGYRAEERVDARMVRTLDGFSNYFGSK